LNVGFNNHERSPCCLVVTGRSLYRRGADGVLGCDPVVAGGVVAIGACTVFPPGAASGMELRGCGDGAWPCGAIAEPEEPGASAAGGGD
jgi:hypothetical protein